MIPQKRPFVCPNIIPKGALKLRFYQITHDNIGRTEKHLNRLPVSILESWIPRYKKWNPQVSDKLPIFDINK